MNNLTVRLLRYWLCQSIPLFISLVKQLFPSSIVVIIKYFCNWLVYCNSCLSILFFHYANVNMLFTYIYSINYKTLMIRPWRPRGGVEVQLCSFFHLGGRWRRVVNALPQLPHPWEMDLVPIVQVDGWAPGSVWMGVENLAPPGFDPQTVSAYS
jgi:hypothetical protein